MLERLFRESPKRTAPPVREEQIHHYQEKNANDPDSSFVFSKDIREENWRSPDPGQYVKRYSKVDDRAKPTGLKHHFEHQVDPSVVMPPTTHDKIRDDQAQRMTNAGHFIHEKLGPEYWRNPDPSQFEARYAKPGLNLFRGPSPEKERIQNIGNDVLYRPRGMKHDTEPPVDPRAIMPPLTKDQLRDLEARQVEESDQHYLARKLTAEHWRSPNPEQFALRYAKPNFSLFEKYGSFPVDVHRSKGQAHPVDEEKLKSLVNDGVARHRSQQVREIEAQPSMIDHLSSKGDPFVTPNNRIQKAIQEAKANPLNFGRATHGMLDGLMKSEPKHQGRRTVQQRAHTSMETEPPIAGFPGVGPNNFEHFHPENWKLSKHAVESDPMGVKRPGVLDLPKLLERNALVHPHYWKPVAAEALMKNDQKMIDQLVPKGPTFHKHVFKPTAVSPRAVQPAQGLPGFPGMGMNAELPLPSKKRIAPEEIRVAQAPHHEVEMRYRRSQSVCL